MARLVLLPLPARRATLHPRDVLWAAVRAGTQPGVTFRLARSRDSRREDDDGWLHEIRTQHPAILPEESDFFVDFSKKNELAKALEGCEGVVLNSQLEDPDVVENETAMLDAANDVGVKDVLKVSTVRRLIDGASTATTMGRRHAMVEEHLRQLAFGGATRILRCSTLMDKYLYGRWWDMVCGRTLSVSVKNGRISLLHPVDLADVLCAKLASPAETSSVEDLHVTGPEALTFQEITQQLSKGIGETVTYSFFPLWAVQPSMWIRGERPEAITNELEMARALERDAEAEVSSTVEAVLGRSPQSFLSFVQQHQDAWPLKRFT
ncbi:hypothetical protein P43SY_010143 [Pythium insidiosum]|uniref:NmrA-like domain-containing protein n=1 Tax=Pythium insidiosum TaxID=114742 RepID=A0AAD5LCL2_PYTIN|nr:hypothetical protein P43SY_010143 [Pythium insidiosum]